MTFLPFDGTALIIFLSVYLFIECSRYSCQPGRVHHNSPWLWKRFRPFSRGNLGVNDSFFKKHVNLIKLVLNNLHILHLYKHFGNSPWKNGAISLFVCVSAMCLHIRHCLCVCTWCWSQCDCFVVMVSHKILRHVANHRYCFTTTRSIKFECRFFGDLLTSVVVFTKKKGVISLLACLRNFVEC